jgi:predicted MFS family arabinose efflux permease
MPPAPSARRSTTPTLAALGLSTFTVSIAATTVSPALSVIQRQFDVTPSDTAWLVTAYFLVASTATPVLSRLGDMRGKRALLLAAMTAFVVGSIVCAVAPSLAVEILGRGLQGMAAAAFPLAYGITRDELAPERVPGAIGFLAATPAVGGALGLPLGGAIAEHASIAAIFWVQTGLGLVALLSVWRLVPDAGERVPGRVDLRGALVFSVGFGLPLLGISRANVWGWGSATTLGCFAVGLLILVAWVRLELATRQPLVNIHTLRRRAVLLTNLTTIVAGFGLFGSFILLPQLAQIPKSTGFGLGLTASAAGLLLVPNAIVNAITSSQAGRVMKRWGSRTPLLVGCCVASGAFTLLAVAHGSAILLVLWSMLLAVGVGLSYPAMPTLILEAVERHETSEASGVNTIMRNAGAAAGSAVAGSVLAAHAAASGTSSDAGFTMAFAIAAAVSMLSVFIGVWIPVRARTAPAADVPRRQRQAAGIVDSAAREAADTSGTRL